MGRYSEPVVLLEEELRWLKAQYYERSIQKSDLCEGNPDQQMLFNEAEVLAAIEIADQAHIARTSRIEAHERKAIPEHFPRIVIEHDLLAEAKMCTKCASPHLLKRIGQGTPRVLSLRATSSSTCARRMRVRCATTR